MKYLITILTIVLLQSCSNQNNSNIINEDKFVDILVDIHMADATLAVKGYSVTSDSTRIRLFYSDVLKKHNVSQKQIKNTIDYYTSNTKQFVKVYKQVSEKIVKLENEYNESTAKKKKQTK